MAKEKYSGMDTSQLEEKLLDLKTALGKERATKSSGTRVEKPAKIKNLRRDIARILTAITAKKKGIVNKPKQAEAKKPAAAVAKPKTTEKKEIKKSRSEEIKDGRNM